MKRYVLISAILVLAICSFASIFWWNYDGRFVYLTRLYGDELLSALTTYWTVISSSKDQKALARVATREVLNDLLVKSKLFPETYPSPLESARILQVIEYTGHCSRVKASLVYGGITTGDPQALHYVVFLKDDGIWKVAIIDQVGAAKADWKPLWPPSESCSTLAP
jgi:hypothetical protein